MTGRILFLVLAGFLVLLPCASLGQQAETTVFDSNGVQIHYVDKGRGAPVVLLHGFTGSYARHLETPGLSAALETAGYRVIGVDCRGHGQSGKPRDASQYGLEMLRDVIRLLDHLGIQRAHIVGYSMGGWIATQLLVRYPARLLTVTLIGAGWEGEDLRRLTSEMLALADAFAKRDATPLIRGVMAGGPRVPTDEEINAANAAFFARNDPEVMSAVATGMLPLYQVSADSLRAADLPVLAINGEHDTRNLASVKRMAGVVPMFEFVELPGATHATSVRPSRACRGVSGEASTKLASPDCSIAWPNNAENQRPQSRALNRAAKAAIA